MLVTDFDKIICKMRESRKYIDSQKFIHRHSCWDNRKREIHDTILQYNKAERGGEFDQSLQLFICKMLDRIEDKDDF